MVTFLSGGTGTPKLLAGLDDHADVTVVGNTGDDVELGGLLVCPDMDTVMFLLGGVLDRDRWWGIADDTTETHDRLRELTEAAGFPVGPRWLPAERQTTGRRIARWRRFSAVAEFMEIGDRDRAVHLARTSLLDEGYTLTETTRLLGDAFGLECRLLPMSDDPVATVIATDSGPMHFQEFWVAHQGTPVAEDVEFRGADTAAPTDDVLGALEDLVVVGPSNPVTSIGPMLALPGLAEALEATRVVAVSPFVDDRVFSGPAEQLMQAVGYPASTRGVAEAYPFVDAFVLDSRDETRLDRPVVRADTRLDTPGDAARVWAACQEAAALVS